jgi:hypothetical protein
LRLCFEGEQRQAQQDRPEAASIPAEHGVILSERLVVGRSAPNLE